MQLVKYVIQGVVSLTFRLHIPLGMWGLTREIHASHEAIQVIRIPVMEGVCQPGIGEIRRYEHEVEGKWLRPELGLARPHPRLESLQDIHPFFLLAHQFLQQFALVLQPLPASIFHPVAGLG